MIKVEVKTDKVEVKQGTSSRTHKPYQIREQEAYAFFLDRDGNPQPYPQRIRLTLDDGAFPYQPGNYTLAPESLFADRYGQISIRAKLRPMAPAARAAA